jgi:hypothetical protein
MNECYNTLFVFNYQMCTSDHALRGSKLASFCFFIQTIIDLHHEYACHLALGTDKAQLLSVACCLYTLLIQQCRRRAPCIINVRAMNIDVNDLFFWSLSSDISYRSRNRSANEKINRRLISRYYFDFILKDKRRIIIML